MPQAVTVLRAHRWNYTHSNSTQQACSCVKDTSPRHRCNGRGTCLNNVCNCTEGFQGPDCSSGPHVVYLYPTVGEIQGGYTLTVACALANFGSRTSFRVLIDGGRLAATATLLSAPSGKLPALLGFSFPDASSTYSAQTAVAIEVSVNGVFYSTNGVQITLVPTPTITSITPNSMYFRGGTVVTVRGNNFMDTTSLRLRIGQQITIATYNGKDLFIATSPVCDGNCSALVGVSGGAAVALSQDAASFRAYPAWTASYFGDCVVSAVVPNTGSQAGSTPVQAAATGMVQGNSLSCRFGASAVVGTLLADSAGRLRCASPTLSTAAGVAISDPGEGGVLMPVNVSMDSQWYTPAPNCTLSPGLCFTYRRPVTVSGVFPTLGPVDGLTPVSIWGVNFYNWTWGQALCLFGSQSSPMRLTSDGAYTCAAPALPSANWPADSSTGGRTRVALRVAPNGVDAVDAGPYDYYVEVSLTAAAGSALSPMAAPYAGGSAVTIKGDRFFSTDRVITRFTTFCQACNDTVSVYSDPARYVSSQLLVITTPVLPTRFYSPDGLVRCTVYVSMNGGLQWSPPSPQTFVYYSQPVIRAVIPPLGPRLGETAVVIDADGLNDFNKQAKCRFGGVVVPAWFNDEAAVNGTSPLQCVTPSVVSPIWVPVEIALDGQSFTNMRTIKFQYLGEYDVISVSPNGGPRAGGTQVTVVAVNLVMSGSFLTCFFGEGSSPCGGGTTYPCYTAVEATYLGTTAVMCTAPPMPAGGDVNVQYPVSVSINGQYTQRCPNEAAQYFCSSKSALLYSYYLDVRITALLPNSGKVQGGTLVTALGVNFRKDREPVTRCVFTACLASEVYMTGSNTGSLMPGVTSCSGTSIQVAVTVIVSSNQLICTTPTASSASTHYAQFDVSFNGGTTLQGKYGPVCQNGCPVLFLFYALPILANTVPSLGPVSGGTVVTIVGLGFYNTQNTATRCRFGTAESNQVTTGVANPVQYISATLMSCVAPPLPEQTVLLFVSLNGLDDDFTTIDQAAPYLYIQPPHLVGTPRPSAGPVSGNTVVTLSGTGFVSGQLRCRFWTDLSSATGYASTTATLLSSTQVSCAAPSAATSGYYSISFTPNAQDYSPFFLQRSFLYYPLPNVTAVIPLGGPAESATPIIVQGIRFPGTGLASCQVGSLTVTGTFVSNTHLLCVAPQIQPKSYSSGLVTDGYLSAEVLPVNWASTAIQSYAVEVSFDGQTYSTSNVQFTYVTSPQVTSIVPSEADRRDGSTTALVSGYYFRGDLGGIFCRFAGIATPANFLSGFEVLCPIPIVPLGQRVILEISINGGTTYESHNSMLFAFYGPAPVLLSAILDSQLLSIKLSFDIDTNMGGQSGRFDCSLAVSTMRSAVDMFGVGHICSWVDNRTLSVNLGYNPSFQVGELVGVRNGTIISGAELSRFSSGMVALQPPPSLPAPVAMTSFVRNLGICDRLTIDATGSIGGAGRALNFRWTVSQDTAQISDDMLSEQQKAAILVQLGTTLQQFSPRNVSRWPFLSCFYDGCLSCVDAACSRRRNDSWSGCNCGVLDVEFGSYPMGTYNLNLVVSNWLGLSSAAITLSVTKARTSVPQVSIALFDDGSRQMSVSSKLFFDSQVAPSTCSSTASSIFSFLWSVRDSTGSAVSLSASVVLTRSSLRLPTFALTPGRTYSVQLAVTDRSTNAQGIDTITFQTASSQPVSVIAGGDRVAGQQDNLVLDGTGSYHPDYSPDQQSQAALTYRWSCAAVRVSSLSAAAAAADPNTASASAISECTTRAGDNRSLPFAFGSGTGAVMMVPASYLEPDTFSMFLFTLTVSSVGGRGVDASARVYPVRGQALRVAVLRDRENFIYNSNDRVYFGSSVQDPASSGSATVATSSLSYAWTTVRGDVNISDARSGALLSSDSLGSVLVIRPGALTASSSVPQTSYTFRLTVTSITGRSGFSQVTIVMNSPPCCGQFRVSRSYGLALETAFSLYAAQYQDAENNIPLKYMFEYYDPSSTSPTYNMLAPWSELTSRSGLVLPAGSVAANGSLGLRARIQDTLGAETIVWGCSLMADVGDNSSSLLGYVPPSGSDAASATAALVAAGGNGRVCAVVVNLRSYASASDGLDDLQRKLALIDSALLSGDNNQALSLATALLTTLDALMGRAFTSGTRRALPQMEGSSSRLRSGNQHEYNHHTRIRGLVSSSAAAATLKCGTMLPRILGSLPANLVSQPDGSVLAVAAAQALQNLFSVREEIDRRCTANLTSNVDVLINYFSSDPYSTQDSTMVQALGDVLSGGLRSLFYQQSLGSASDADVMAQVPGVLRAFFDVTALLAMGTQVGETVKQLSTSTILAQVAAYSASVRTVSSSRRRRRRYRDDELEALLTLPPSQGNQRISEPSQLAAERALSNQEQALPTSGGDSLSGPARRLFQVS
mmetsp:Transcript_5970/g.19335  ORF Transcript_5970/g.19335 Transcript_5970/m.19335 type:complete len:2410 (+) Transcript_5970:1343-8572(+)